VDVKQHVCDLYKLNNINTSVFNNTDCLIHCAATVNQIGNPGKEPTNPYRKLNFEATLKLASMAAKQGVKRFIYISSIKVNGESSSFQKPFTPQILRPPLDPYALSKYEAEEGLMKLAKKTGIEITIIRPPLIYGPGVKANFRLLINLVKKGVPLPLRLIRNKRSLIALDNLVNFIQLCADRSRSPLAANEIFLVSDGNDVSTCELFQAIAAAYDVPSRLLPFPVLPLRFATYLIGKNDVGNRLFSDLQIDGSKAFDLLGWTPIVSMSKQLEKMAELESMETVL